MLVIISLKQEDLNSDPTSAQDGVVYCPHLRCTSCTQRCLVVRLERAAANRISARITDRPEGVQMAKEAEVYIIGHPCGLPLKVAAHPKSVVTKALPTTFVARLDAFGGNSGSPVFNRSTHRVEGILIEGQKDFLKVNVRNRVAIYPLGGEDGETCYDICQVLQHVKQGNTG